MNPVGELKTCSKWLVRLQNEIAGNLPGKQYKDWIARLVNAVETNTDFEDCRHRFLARLLRECLVFDREQNPECADAINAIAELHDRWQDVDESAWYAAESAAWSAAKSAWSAAWSAAESAAESAAKSAKSAAWSAKSAAKSAKSAAWSAESAWSAAWSAAESAAWSAAWSAKSAAWSAWSAAKSGKSAAKSAAWLKIADILLEEVER